MVMVQSLDSTEYDGMPSSAIATGMVDYVLPPREMPAQLIAYVRHPKLYRAEIVTFMDFRLPRTEPRLWTVNIRDHVRRISQGGASFLSMIGHLERITNAYLEGEPTELSADTAPAYHLMPQLAYR